MNTLTVRPRGRQPSFLLFTSIALILSILICSGLAGCGGPSAVELEAVDYTPLPGGEWPVSTPEEQGLDPGLVAGADFGGAKTTGACTSGGDWS